jgi:hypothetical protein
LKIDHYAKGRPLIPCWSNLVIASLSYLIESVAPKALGDRGDQRCPRDLPAGKKDSPGLAVNAGPRFQLTILSIIGGRGSSWISSNPCIRD